MFDSKVNRKKPLCNLSPEPHFRLELLYRIGVMNCCTKIENFPIFRICEVLLDGSESGHFYIETLFKSFTSGGYFFFQINFFSYFQVVSNQSAEGKGQICFSGLVY